MKLNLVKNYKNYDRYKDSGVEWLGDIPENWNAEKIKTKIQKHFSGVWGEEKKEDVNDFLCLRVADFDYPKLSFKNVETIRNITPKDQHRVLRNQDILMEKSGGGDKQPVGRAIFFNSDKEMFCANFIEVLRLNRVADSKFFAYLFFGLYNIGLNKRSIKQNTGIQNLDLNYFLDEIVPLPPKQTQRKIADYLDEKTETIDKAIKRKKKLIELLEEKKKTIVDFCFNKIAKENDITKLKFLTTKVNSGVTPRGGSESYIDEGIPLIRSLNVYFSGFKFEDLVFISKETHSNMRNSQLRIGDVLLNITGASIGRCYYFSGEFDEANVNQHVCIIRVNSKKIYSKFLYYLLSTKKKQDEIMNLQVGASREGLNYQQIKNFDVPIVDLNKQQEIVDYLDKKTQDIDKIVEKINQSINLLTEYKSSLISHVVTGKVKV